VRGHSHPLSFGSNLAGPRPIWACARTGSGRRPIDLPLPHRTIGNQAFAEPNTTASGESDEHFGAIVINSA